MIHFWATSYLKQSKNDLGSTWGKVSSDQGEKRSGVETFLIFGLKAQTEIPLNNQDVIYLFYLFI